MEALVIPTLNAAAKVREGQYHRLRHHVTNRTLLVPGFRTGISVGVGKMSDMWRAMTPRLHGTLFPPQSLQFKRSERVPLWGPKGLLMDLSAK